MSEAVKDTVIAEEDLLRADLYDFLAALLSSPPDTALLQRAAGLGGDDSELGRAISTLARIAKAMKETAVEREFNALFIGLGRGELMPFASYYLTGFLNEKPLATLRSDMAGLRITRAPNVYEPEDNIASLLEMMAGMIRGRFGAPVPLGRQKDFYFTHIAPWAEHFFSDLEAAQNSVFYAPVGTVAKAFLEIETQAFRMGAE
ncbi:molecular chaperone TorD family protein [Shimia sp. R10_1]|uniref:TorD/DmsD family molecular chaperone n=1 Tax=Shimia sp. R10_1 TaxID=2821095 RepID=UPI001ADCE9AE|nr:molecular chaperone TorD family protein [Shimia sp. R10_1]MBO9473835.1 molecular chaperone TorD family protein [Shimia sp. R10_1]